MSDEEGELREKIAKLDVGIAEKNRNIKRTASQVCKHRKQARLEEQVSLNPFCKLVSCIIYALSAYNAAPALAYVSHVLNQKRDKERWWPDDQLIEAIENAWLGMDVDALANILDPKDSPQMNALILAWKWYTEWQLITWISEKNYTQGVAPTTQIILEQNARYISAAPESVQPCCCLDAHTTPARVWALRWRLRWGAHHGRLPTQEPIGLQAKRDKAMLCLILLWSLPRSSLAFFEFLNMLIPGASGGSRFWGHIWYLFLGSS